METVLALGFRHGQRFLHSSPEKRKKKNKRRKKKRGGFCLIGTAKASLPKNYANQSAPLLPGKGEESLSTARHAMICKF